MSFSSAIDTSRFAFNVGRRIFGRKTKEPGNVQMAPWQAVAFLRNFHGVDIDEYRTKRGKEEGEAAFFHDNEPDEQIVKRFNMFFFNGACLLFQAALNNGTTTPNVGFPTPTLLTNSNTYLYVSDGGPTALSGTASVTNGSGTVTTSASQSGIIGLHAVFTGDSSSQVYTVVSGSGTSWTISPVYGGATGSGLTMSTIVAETHSMTTVPGSTNVANQVADSGFPSNPTTAQFNAVSAASNATPVVLTTSGADISANDIAQVVEVLGNTGANGVYVCNPASAGSITLLGSSGTGTYTSGGLISKRSVMTIQSTFGASSAIFQWCWWSIVNGNSTNKIVLQGKAVGLGSKSSGTSSALKVGLGIG